MARIEDDLTAAGTRAARAWLGTDVAGPAAALAGSGFSGAPVTLVERNTTGERFVLKAFAPGTQPARAAWVHGLASHLRAHGVSAAPDVVPLPGGDGATVHANADGLWECVRFVPGRATDLPTPAQSAAAAATLAQVHRAAAAIPGLPPAEGVSPGLARRTAQAAALAAAPWTAAAHGSAGTEEDSLPIRERYTRSVDLLRQAGGQHALAAVAAWRTGPVLAQAVLRDVWSDHVLFGPATPGVVAGIVDFHAAGVDTPATDLARLLGSWQLPAGSAPETPLLARWPEAIAAYEQWRPLSPAERWLVEALDASAVVCGLDNWFRWTLLERRSFTRPDLVLARIDVLLDRLPGALARLHTMRDGPAWPSWPAGLGIRRPV